MLLSPKCYLKLGLLSIAFASMAILFTDSFGFISLFIIFPIILLITGGLWLIARKVKQHDAIYLMASIGPSVVIAGLYIYGSWYSITPEVTFKRHFKTAPPDSVKLITKQGYVSMGGSNEYLVFIMPQDELKSLAEANGFKLSDLDGAQNISSNLWDSFQQEALLYGIEPDLIYIEGDIYSFRIILTNDQPESKILLIYYSI